MRDDEYRFKLIATYCKGKTLDVGCGKANLKKYLPFATYQGIDLHPSNNYILRCYISYDELPFKDKFFDTIVISEVLEHLDNPTHALKECKRVLKDDGILIGSVPNIETIGRVLLHIFTKVYNKRKEEHIIAIGSIELNNILRQTGFKPILFKYIWFVYRWLGSKWLFFKAVKDNTK
jgi:2-polyprenyl-3-methyl-5-hydroxy-6-metoxy-1,4-benzoquinol methylase